MTSGNVTEEFVHEDLSYISQNLLTKDAGQRNQALRLDVRDCAHNPQKNTIYLRMYLTKEILTDLCFSLQIMITMMIMAKTAVLF